MRSNFALGELPHRFAKLLLLIGKRKIHVILSGVSVLSR